MQKDVVATWDDCRKHRILIMTPKILEDLLTCGTVKFWDICLLIFDEAHHCSGDHPYAQIMRQYSEASKPDRPHILGMTASPVNSKVKSREKLISSLVALESLMDSTLATIHDKALKQLQQVLVSTPPYACLARSKLGCAWLLPVCTDPLTLDPVRLKTPVYQQIATSWLLLRTLASSRLLGASTRSSCADTAHRMEL